MQSLGKKLGDYFVKMGAEDATASRKQAIANVEQAQTRLRDAAAKLGMVKPPGKIELDQEKLIAAVREYANELDEIIVKLKTGNTSALAEIAQLQGIKDMGTATRAITRAGYDITDSGPIPGGGPLSR